MGDIEDIKGADRTYWVDNITQEDLDFCIEFLKPYYYNQKDCNDIKNNFMEYQRQSRVKKIYKFGYLMYTFNLALSNKIFEKENKFLADHLTVKDVRAASGVTVFSVFTSPYPNGQDFSCKSDCHYCPKQPDMPRSYLRKEPGAERAYQQDFDPVKQIIVRGKQYIGQNTPISKAEVIIQGGSFFAYPREYLIDFIRDIYFTFNTFHDLIQNKEVREKKTLEEEILINETAIVRVIGLTPETRPDDINYETLQFFRKINATRVQLGVQHLNDDILKYNNRGCYTRHTIKAIKMLKDNGFKVDCHLMPDMPMPDYISQEEKPEIDRQMFEEFNTNSDFKCDQIKIYPCVVLDHTEIKKWYDAGIYVPYGEEQPIDPKLSKDEKLMKRFENPLYKNIMDYYQNIHPSIRVNRVIRDFDHSDLLGGTKNLGLRSELDRYMELMKIKSNDIRYREVGNYRHRNKKNLDAPILRNLRFESSGGIEHFITFESPDTEILYGFLRLRFSDSSGKYQSKVIFPELVNTALIRELHVYGRTVEHGKHKENAVQHTGLGTKLLQYAEDLARKNNYQQIAVISGVGVREYYRKRGYTTKSQLGEFMIKDLSKSKNNIGLKLLILFIVMFALFIGFYYFSKN